MAAFMTAGLCKIIAKMVAEMGYRYTLENIVSKIGGIHGGKLF